MGGQRLIIQQRASGDGTVATDGVWRAPVGLFGQFAEQSRNGRYDSPALSFRAGRSSLALRRSSCDIARVAERNLCKKIGLAR